MNCVSHIRHGQRTRLERGKFDALCLADVIGINFMAKEGRGLICLALSSERLRSARAGADPLARRDLRARRPGRGGGRPGSAGLAAPAANICTVLGEDGSTAGTALLAYARRLRCAGLPQLDDQKR